MSRGAESVGDGASDKKHGRRADAIAAHRNLRRRRRGEKQEEIARQRGCRRVRHEGREQGVRFFYDEFARRWRHREVSPHPLASRRKPETPETEQTETAAAAAAAAARAPPPQKPRGNARDAKQLDVSLRVLNVVARVESSERQKKKKIEQTIFNFNHVYTS